LKTQIRTKDMAKIKGAVVVNTERCKGCELCVVACPKDVLAMSKQVNTKGYNYAFPEKEEDCIGCAACGYVCPDACITIYKVKINE
jgi:2-oxoglutarate ferredoxin oxidoreductase subunit delta